MPPLPAASFSPFPTPMTWRAGGRSCHGRVNAALPAIFTSRYPAALPLWHLHRRTCLHPPSHRRALAPRHPRSLVGPRRVLLSLLQLLKPEQFALLLCVPVSELRLVLISALRAQFAPRSRPDRAQIVSGVRVRCWPPKTLNPKPSTLNTKH